MMRVCYPLANSLLRVSSCAVEWLSVGGASLPRHRASHLSRLLRKQLRLTEGPYARLQDLIFLNCKQYNDPDSEIGARRSTLRESLCPDGLSDACRQGGQANPGKSTASLLCRPCQSLTAALCVLAVGVLARGAHEARCQGDQHLLHRRVHRPSAAVTVCGEVCGEHEMHRHL